MGTGPERVIGAIVGGSVALVLGVLLFPAQPLAILEEAEKGSFARWPRRSTVSAGMLRSASMPADEWILDEGRRIHQLLATLSRVRSIARNRGAQPSRYRRAARL
jgi:hypothetical protein